MTHPPADWAQEKRDLYLGDIIAHLRRHWYIIAAAVVASLLLAVAYTSTQIPIYGAHATLRVDEKQPSLPVLDALEPSRAPGELQTEMAVLHSRSLAEEVVDSLALQVVLVEPKKTPRRELFTDIRADRRAPWGDYVIYPIANERVAVDEISERIRVGDFDPERPIRFRGITLVLSPRGRTEANIRVRVDAFDDAVSGVVGGLAVSRLDREANVVVVGYEAADPYLTRDVPNVLVTRFLARRESERKFGARSTARLLREQRDSVALELARAENELRAFRERTQSIDLNIEAQQQVSRAADLQAERNRIAAERDALAVMLAEVRAEAQSGGRDQPSPYRRMLAFPTLLRNAVASDLLRALSAAEEQRANLRTRRTPEDPDVQLLSGRLAELEQEVRTITETYVQGLSNQVASLDATLARSGQNLARIPGKEVQYARLQRGPTVLADILAALQTRLKEAEIAQAVPDSRIRIVDLAILPGGPVRPNAKLNLALALIVGLGLGAGAALAYGMLHKTIRTAEDVKAVIAAPILGLIPHIPPSALQNRGRWAGLLRRSTTRAYESPGPAAEAYRALRTNITHRGWVAGGRTLLFTSPRVGDGKTTSAINTALALAQQGLRILLVDADLRRGALHHVFGVRQAPGLSEILTDRYSSIDELLQHVVGNEAKLDFITCGALPRNPAELLGSGAMAGLIARLKREYDVVVFDTPPVNLVTDAVALGAYVEGIIIVTRAGATGPQALEFAIERLHSVESRVVGVLLNDVDFRRDARAYGIDDYAAYYASPSS